jgi:hypothetical protein
MFFFRKAISSLERLVTTYVRYMIAKRYMFGPNELARLKEDIRLIRTFFSTHLRDKVVDAKMNQLVAILNLLIWYSIFFSFFSFSYPTVSFFSLSLSPSPLHEITTRFQEFLRVNPSTVSKALVRTLLSQRQDLDKSSLKTAIKACKNLLQQTQVSSKK